jgi:hypothetical protein
VEIALGRMECDVMTFSRIHATDAGMHGPGLVFMASADCLLTSLFIYLFFFFVCLREKTS